MFQKYCSTQNYNIKGKFYLICRHHGKFLFLSMPKQWIEVEGHVLYVKTLNVKTHRNISHFFNKRTVCLFYSSNEDFQSLISQPELLKYPV